MVREASQGDPQDVRKRLEILGELTVLRLTAESERLTRALLATGQDFALVRNYFRHGDLPLFFDH
jgi:hypothetical protein